LRLRADPERERHRRLRDEQQPERRGQLRERRRRPQGPKDPELDQEPDAEQEDGRDHERRCRRHVHAELSGPQRPVAVPGEHRHRTGREVDDPRAAVGEDDPDRDPRDQRPCAEAEDREEDDLLPVHT
jgi:hypothetical protein